MTDVTAYAQSIVKMYNTGRREALADAARIAAHFTMTDNWSIHPDILGKDMNEASRVAAHSTAQQIAMAIQSLMEKVPS